MSTHSAPETVSPVAAQEAEWKARVDLAATYRLCGHYGWSSLIYNHISLRVPHEHEFMLVKPNDLLFEEVTASNLLKVSCILPAEKVSRNVNKAGYTIHTAVLNARAELNCCVHVHTTPGMAMSACAEGLLPLNQGAMRFFKRLSYHDYEGVATHLEESERIASDLGHRNKAMIMRNHGLLTAGTNCAEALSIMRSLVVSCETQLLVQASGNRITFPSEEVCERAAQHWDKLDSEIEWPAQMRFAERVSPGFRV
jgi:ribulose-5-phosphate 4-epimerase/fuculose-1-phosphate aldolase